MMESAVAACATQETMLNAEVGAWSAYWSKFSNRNTPKAELDRLMDTAPQVSADLHKHIAQCAVCRAKTK
jgi:hypothetical protein